MISHQTRSYSFLIMVRTRIAIATAKSVRGQSLISFMRILNWTKWLVSSWRNSLSIEWTDPKGKACGAWSRTYVIAWEYQLSPMTPLSERSRSACQHQRWHGKSCEGTMVLSRRAVAKVSPKRSSRTGTNSRSGQCGLELPSRTWLIFTTPCTQSPRSWLMATSTTRRSNLALLTMESRTPRAHLTHST